MDTAGKHIVPDRVKQSFAILTSGHTDAHSWVSECPDVKNSKWQLNPVWHRMLYSRTHMATVDVRGLRCSRGRTSGRSSRQGVNKSMFHGTTSTCLLWPDRDSAVVIGCRELRARDIADALCSAPQTRGIGRVSRWNKYYTAWIPCMTTA